MTADILVKQHSSSEPPDFIFTSCNQPFAPMDNRTAVDIRRDVEQGNDKEDAGFGLDSIQRTLLKSWRDDVDSISQKRG